MNYAIVSGDSHVDMSMLPGDLFVDNAPAHLKGQVPHIEDTDEGPRWVAEGRILGVVQSAGFEFIPAQRGRWKRTDRMLDAGFYDGRGHPTDPELRLKDIIMDGVDAEVIYGITGTGKNLIDRETIAAVYRIYNDWVNEFCGKSPGRWYALACIPIHDPCLAASELMRAARLDYIRGADLMAAEVSRPIYSRDGYWNPLWKALAETELPLSFHIGGAPISVPPPPDDGSTEIIISDRQPTQNELAYRGVTDSLGQLSGAQWLSGILLSGACELFPNFRFVMGEAGAAWIPFVLGRLDHTYLESSLDKEFDPPLTMLPSEYWFRQGATTFQEEPVVGQMASIIGENNLMWGSDYPHPDGVWPDSKKVIKETMGQLEPTVLRKIIRDNAVKLYRIGQ